MPKLYQPIMDDIAYHIRESEHNVIDFDWEHFIDFEDKHFFDNKGSNV